MTQNPESATSPPTTPDPPQPQQPPAPTGPAARQPRRRPAGLFREPPTSPSLPPPATPTDPLPPSDAPASASGSPDDAAPPKGARAPRASSVSPSDSRQIKKAVKAAVRTLGGRLNSRADELERDEGIYLADDQDQEGIADPVSSLLARRNALAVNSDVADLLALLVAVFAYVDKQLDIKVRVRRMRKSGAVNPDLAAKMTDEGAPAA